MRRITDGKFGYFAIFEIAREENMTRPPNDHFISQPSLSRQMKELEVELGKNSLSAAVTAAIN